MNKHIRKAWEDAINGDNTWEGQVKFIDAFAHNIVNECLKQCEMIRDDASVQKESKFLTSTGRTLYEGVYGGATNCGFAIQQHFGLNDEIKAQKEIGA